MRNISAAILLFLHASLVMGQEEMPQRENGPSFNHVSLGINGGLDKIDEYDDSVINLGIFAHTAINEQLLAGLTLDYWKKGDMPAPLAVSLSDLIIGLNGKYVLTDRNAGFQPYLLAGATIHRFSFRNRNQETLSNEETSVLTYMGLDIGGGGFYRIRRDLDLLGEVKYRAVNKSHPNLSQIAFTVGASYSM